MAQFTARILPLAEMVVRIAIGDSLGNRIGRAIAMLWFSNFSLCLLWFGGGSGWAFRSISFQMICRFNDFGYRVESYMTVGIHPAAVRMDKAIS